MTHQTHPIRTLPAWLGPLFTSVVIAAMSIFTHLGVVIPDAAPILMVTLAISSVSGRLSSAAISSTMGMVYSYYFFSKSGHVGTFTYSNALRVTALWIIIPIQSGLIVWLKRREYLVWQQLLRVNSQRVEGQSRYRALFDFNPNAIFTCSLDGKIQHVNRQASELFAPEQREHIIGQMLEDLVYPESHYALQTGFRTVSNGSPQLYEIRLRSHAPDGTMLDITQLPIFRDQIVAGTFIIAHDMTERKKREGLIRHMAYHDSLTDLPNRRQLHEHLVALCAQPNRPAIGLLFLDVDHFKRINDRLGHPVGDQTLRIIAQRLSTVVGSKGLLARLGGDEFCVVISPALSAYTLQHVADQVIEAMEDPVAIGELSFQVTFSIGVTWEERRGTASPDELLRRADVAVYRAKAAGRNQSHYAITDHHVSWPEIGEVDLLRAVRSDELTLAYQPVVRSDGSIIGLEALVRWNHPTKGLLAPDTFLPIAEEFGLMERIDSWVMTKAFAQFVTWQRTNLATSSTSPYLIGVNVTPTVFTHPRFLSLFTQIMEDTAISPKNIVLEVPERLILSDADAVFRVLTAIQSLGVHVCLDDFGAGYTSVSHLKRLPLRSLKIDRQFIQGIGHSSLDETILQHIVGMSQQLAIDVVAEGVETEAQRQFLTSIGCHEFQGYLLARPMPDADAEKLLYTTGLPITD